MKKEKRITLYKKIWCKIRYWQSLNDVSNEELARILCVSTRTLLTYDKNAENITLGKLDRFINATGLDIGYFIANDDTTEDDDKSQQYNAFENRIVYNSKTYYEINPCLDCQRDTYYVSLDGEIYSKAKKRVLHPTADKDGYLYQIMKRNNGKHMKISVAKIILTTFQGTPPKDMIDPTTEHINSQRTDNRIDNLTWLERSENSSTRKNTGKGESNSKAKLTENQVRRICELLVEGKMTIVEIAKKYNVDPSCISSIKQHRNWTYITNNYTF